MGPGAVLCCFALDDHTGRGSSSLSVRGNLEVQSGASLLLGCEPGHFTCLDDPAPEDPTLSSQGQVSGNLIEQEPLGVVVHNSIIDGNVQETGGGGGASCEPTGVFAAFGSPVYSDYEDTTVHGNLSVTGLSSCWLGVARVRVSGNLSMIKDQLADPDAIEILANHISGNLSCQQNSQVWDSADETENLYPRAPEPNTVSGRRSGQCARLSSYRRWPSRLEPFQVRYSCAASPVHNGREHTEDLMTARTAVVSIRQGAPRIGRLRPVVIAAVLALLCVPGVAAGSVSPLPSSDYTVRAVCARAARGRGGCLALQLVPRTAAARARRHPLGLTRSAPLTAPSPGAGAFGLRPQDLHTAYDLPASASSAQTVALVDAYNDPTAEADLKAYDEEFSLPACTAGNGCFKQVNQNGEAGNLPFPKTTTELEAARRGSRAAREEAAEATGWGLEISLDIEVAHATCESCEILLVEAGVAEL